MRLAGRVVRAVSVLMVLVVSVKVLVFQRAAGARLCETSSPNKEIGL